MCSGLTGSMRVRTQALDLQREGGHVLSQRDPPIQLLLDLGVHLGVVRLLLSLHIAYRACGDALAQTRFCGLTVHEGL